MYHLGISRYTTHAKYKDGKYFVSARTSLALINAAPWNCVFKEYSRNKQEWWPGIWHLKIWCGQQQQQQQPQPLLLLLLLLLLLQKTHLKVLQIFCKSAIIKMATVRKFEVISDAGGVCAMEIQAEGPYFIRQLWFCHFPPLLRCASGQSLRWANSKCTDRRWQLIVVTHKNNEPIL